MKITENFWHSEVINWANHQNMTETDRATAIALATEAYNAAHPEFNGNVGFTVLSWLRPIKWELKRNRSGKSMHTSGNAVDIIVSGVSEANQEKIMRWLWLSLRNWHGGLAKLDRDNRIRFIHLDLGEKRRWEY
jgi:uncharacterized protein YcbK (DUF882 family)